MMLKSSKYSINVIIKFFSLSNTWGALSVKAHQGTRHIVKNVLDAHLPMERETSLPAG